MALCRHCILLSLLASTACGCTVPWLGDANKADLHLHGMPVANSRLQRVPPLPPLPASRARGATSEIDFLEKPSSAPFVQQESSPVHVTLASAVAEEPSDAVPGEPLPATLDLIELIHQAFRSNPEVRSAVERTRAANGSLSSAEAEYRPRLTAAANYGLSNVPQYAFTYHLNQGQVTLPQNVSNPDAIDDFHGQLRLQQDVYDGGKRAAQERAASALVSAASYDVQARRNELSFRVAEAYYRLLQARDLLRVRTQAVRQMESHLENVRTRMRAETAVRSDELAVRVRLAEARDAVVTAENQLELGWAVLENIVGDSVPRRPLPESIPPAPGADLPESLPAEIGQAYSKRPEIRRLGGQQSAASAGVRAAESGSYPRIQLVGDYDVHTGDFVRGKDGFYVGLLTSVAFFDGGRTGGSVVQAIAHLRELRARCHRLRLDIELEVRQATLNLKSASERLALATESVREAEEALRSVEVQYRVESTTLLYLLDAQVLAADARARKAQAEADVQIARMDLARALGLLVQPPPVTTDNQGGQ